MKYLLILAFLAQAPVRAPAPELPEVKLDDRDYLKDLDTDQSEVKPVIRIVVSDYSRNSKILQSELNRKNWPLAKLTNEIKRRFNVRYIDWHEARNYSEYPQVSLTGRKVKLDFSSSGSSILSLTKHIVSRDAEIGLRPTNEYSPSEKPNSDYTLIYRTEWPPKPYSYEFWNGEEGKRWPFTTEEGALIWSYIKKNNHKHKLVIADSVFPNKLARIYLDYLGKCDEFIVSLLPEKLCVPRDTAVDIYSSILKKAKQKQLTPVKIPNIILD